jgi:hypothetical protein
VAEKAAHVMAAEKQKQRTRRARVPIYPLAKISPTRPHLLEVPPLSYSAAAGVQAFNRWLLAKTFKQETP